MSKKILPGAADQPARPPTGPPPRPRGPNPHAHLRRPNPMPVRTLREGFATGRALVTDSYSLQATGWVGRG